MFKVINEHYILNENTGEHLDLKDACKMLNRKDKQINDLRRRKKPPIVNDDFIHTKHYTQTDYTGKSSDDIRFKERTEEALRRVEESDHKGMSVDEFTKELGKW